jgi:hypothetical protein
MQLGAVEMFELVNIERLESNGLINSLNEVSIEELTS